MGYVCGFAARSFFFYLQSHFLTMRLRSSLSIYVTTRNELGCRIHPKKLQSWTVTWRNDTTIGRHDTIKWRHDTTKWRHDDNQRGCWERRVDPVRQFQVCPPGDLPPISQSPSSCSTVWASHGGTPTCCKGQCMCMYISVYAATPLVLSPIYIAKEW